MSTAFKRLPTVQSCIVVVHIVPAFGFINSLKIKLLVTLGLKSDTKVFEIDKFSYVAIQIRKVTNHIELLFMFYGVFFRRD